MDLFSKKNLRKTTTKTLVVAMAILLSGCYSIGPREVRLDRGRYNDIVRDTDNAQTLKNIVRLAYLEAPAYLGISNVTASYSLSTSASPSSTWTSPPSNSWSTSMGISPSYSDSPTISYVPVDNKEFVEGLLTPLDFGKLQLFFRASVTKTKLVMRLAFDRIGTLDNATFSTTIGVSKVTVRQKYEYQKYLAFAEAVERLIQDKRMAVALVTYEERTGAVLQFLDKAPVTSKDAYLIKDLLHIPQECQQIILLSSDLVRTVSEQEDGELVLDQLKRKNLVFVTFRSIYGIMTYLSHGVEIPKSDIKAHMVRRAIDESTGQDFNWNLFLNGVMKVHSSRYLPRNDIFVATKFHRHWFYIKESDHASKIAFSMLTRLQAVVKGGQTGGEAAPVLTIPVGR
jgi:hypothetical protein